MNDKSDSLVGLKENVILGKPIPAGTGLSRWRRHRPSRRLKAIAISRGRLRRRPCPRTSTRWVPADFGASTE